MKKNLLNLILITLTAMISMSCAKPDQGFAPALIAVGEEDQLVYGNSMDDRNRLANRITGNVPPQFSEVISHWKRFSGTQYYPDVNQVVATPAYCQTTLDSTGSWTNSTSPVVNPNTSTDCNTASINSLSWVYLANSDRLFNIQNTAGYNGFFSNLKYDNYISITTLSSSNSDDDGLGVIIAIYFDSVANKVHTLSAYRTQGGVAPVLGWGLLYKVNGAVIKIIGNQSIGGTNKNTAPTTGDALGWNGRNSQIRVERTGHIIKAFTSDWSTGYTSLDVDPTSLIQIDLADPANGLTEFKGPQAYGYETISQARATFSDLKFLTPQTSMDPENIFDLKLNLVYGKKANGIGYEVLPGKKALDTLGFPKIITNNETGRAFKINSATSFDAL